MRKSHRLARLGIADGVLVAVLIWRWAIGGEPHHLSDTVTVFALLFGFVGAAASALRNLRRRHRPGTLDAEQRNALLPLRAVGSSRTEPSNGIAPPAAAQPPWLTTIAYSALMIALLWQWAILGKPYTVLGAVTLSILMLGFLRATASTVESLGRADHSRAAGQGNEPLDALLLFPAENARANNKREPTPHMLAPRRNSAIT